MATTARLDLSIWRNDDVYEFPLRVVGPNLTGIAMRAQVRLRPDTRGAALVTLAQVTNGNAEGVRLASAVFDGTVWTNDVRIRINKSTRQALPYSGEIGDSALLAWAFQIAGRTRITGTVAILAHTMDSDAAPADRPSGYGSAIRSDALASGASMTIAADDVAVLKLDAADLIVPYAAQAVASAGDASAFADAAGGHANDASLSAATALTASMMYPTTAAGLAVVAEGGFFTVAGTGDTYAILYRKTAGVAVERVRYASKAAYEGTGGATLIGTNHGNLQDRLDNLGPYAADRGVRGNRVDDDSAAIEDYIADCAAKGWLPRFGNLRMRTTRALLFANSGCVIDAPGLSRDAHGGLGEPGFYPELLTPDTPTYTALTFIGQGAPIRVSVIGRGDVQIANTATLVSDTRERIVGIQFGSDQVPFIHGVGVSARAVGLRETGIKGLFVNDSNFGLLSTELCGTVINPGAGQEERYAIDFMDGGTASDGSRAVLNMSTIANAQPERSIGRALRFDVFSYEYEVGLGHVERLIGVPGDIAPKRAIYLSGSGTINRLSAQSYSQEGLGVTAYGQNTVIKNATLRDGLAEIECAADNGQTLTVEKLRGVARSADASSGQILLKGGAFDLKPGKASGVYAASWIVTDAQIGNWEMGGTTGNFQLINSPMNTITRHPTVASCFAVLNRSGGTLTVSPHRGSQITQIGGIITPKDGAIELSECLWVIRGGVWSGSVSCSYAAIGLRADSHITGNFTQAGGDFQSLCDLTSTIDGQVTGWSTPLMNGLLGNLRKGTRNQGYQSVAGDAPDHYAIKGDNAWHPVG